MKKILWSQNGHDNQVAAGKKFSIINNIVDVLYVWND